MAETIKDERLRWLAAYRKDDADALEPKSTRPKTSPNETPICIKEEVIALRKWNITYNDLEHCGLNGKTPNEALADYKLINPPNVCA